MLLNSYYSFGGIQLCVYPLEVMGLSQLMFTGPSHMGRPAIDDAGRGIGKCTAGAPFDALILWKKPYGSKTGILITNTRTVLCPHEKLGFVIMPPRTANVLLWHDDDTSNLQEGQRIPQGTPFYTEGTADNASGNHIHIMVSFGEWDGNYPMDYLPKYNSYTLRNAVEPYNFFFVNDTVRRRDGGYPWKEFVFPKNEIPLKYLLKVNI